VRLPLDSPRLFIDCTSAYGKSECAISQWCFRKKVRPSERAFYAEFFTSLGRQLAELCQFPTYTPENVDAVVVYDGLENYERAYGQGKGVLFLTAHFGAWELSAFAHSLHGHWLHVVMRPMDNEYLDRLLQHYRTMHGNKTVAKDDFVRGLLAAMKAGETVGILMDTNMTPPQGIFVDSLAFPPVRRVDWPALLCARTQRWFRGSRFGIQHCESTACDSIPRSN